MTHFTHAYDIAALLMEKGYLCVVNDDGAGFWIDVQAPNSDGSEWWGLGTANGQWGGTLFNDSGDAVDSFETSAPDDSAHAIVAQILPQLTHRGCRDFARYAVKTTYGTYHVCTSCVDKEHMAPYATLVTLATATDLLCQCEHVNHFPQDIVETSPLLPGRVNGRT